MRGKGAVESDIWSANSTSAGWLSAEVAAAAGSSPPHQCVATVTVMLHAQLTKNIRHLNHTNTQPVRDVAGLMREKNQVQLYNMILS